MITESPNTLILNKAEMKLLNKGGFIILTFVGDKDAYITTDMLETYQFEDGNTRAKQLVQQFLTREVKDKIRETYKFNKRGLLDAGFKFKLTKDIK